MVLDDGDGRGAGYRWEQREGEASPSWHKIHDMDWSSDSILSALQDIAQELYVFRGGRTDLDASGNPITGLYAGQTIYGGSASGQNLTLNANSGDGTGAESGYVQSDNTFRPTSDNALDLGTLTERFRDLFISRNLSDGTNTLTIAQGKAAYDHLQISSGNPHGTGYDDLSNKLGALTADGDASGSVDLSTSGAKTITLTVADNSHNHVAANITDFDSAVYFRVGDILLNGTGITWSGDDLNEQITPTIDVSTDEINNISNPEADKILVGNAAGTDWVSSSGEIELTGDVTGSATYDSTTDKWEIATLVVTTPLPFTLTNKTFTSAAGDPTTVTATAHGLATNEYVKIFSSSFDGVYQVTVLDANSFTVPTLTGAPSSGYYIPQYGQLLYDPASGQFQVAKEYEQISHHELSNLTADDHTQYVAKDGRSGGQTVKGGTGAGDNLILESTSNVSKGTVQTANTFTPTTDAAYSGGWSGTDLGSTTKRFNDIHMAGEAKGLRAENLGALPANSGTTIGRMVFFDGLPYWDNGVDWVSGGGGGPRTVTTKVANYTATVDDDVIICNGTFTVSLPDATDSDNLGLELVIKNIGTGTISIDPFSSQTLDGSTLYDIVDQWASITVVCDGSNWVIV